MKTSKTCISFTADYNGEKYELQTYKGEYRNLMILLYDKIYIEDFGECKGMGRCGTCVVKINGLPAAVNSQDRNEERTLYKMGIYANDARLACQVSIDESLQNTTVEIIGSDAIV